MSSKFPGGFITKSPVAPTTSAASGIWTLDQQEQYQKAGTWPQQPPPPYIEDVFSTQVYTGTGATNNIVNGVDLATYGGLVWTKARTTTSAFSFAHALIDTLRGAGVQICSDRTDANYTQANSLTGFNTNGYTLGTDSGGQGRVNNTSYGTQTYASWTFRKQAKFFDVVTWTGDGVAGRQISHSLGSAPGAIIVKCTNLARDWAVWQNTLSDGTYLKLNTTDSVITNTSFQVFGDASGQTSTYFTVGKSGAGVNGLTNANGDTYVAYLFADDAGGFGATETENVISCGSFTTNGSGAATVSLGYEPQMLIVKRTNAAEDWFMVDNMRGWFASPSVDTATLKPNSSGAEFTWGSVFAPSATGFTYNYNPSATYIYIAIRRGPMKTPTIGTSVFSPVAYTGNGGTQSLTTNFAGDMAWIDQRSNAGQYVQSFDKLRGNNVVVYQNATNAEETNSPTSYTVSFNNTQTVLVGPYSPNGIYNNSGSPQIAWNFKRATSFFDEVCYTGTGSARTINHNLGVTPELMIVKCRSGALDWTTYQAPLGASQVMRLNSNIAAFTDASVWNGTAPTSSVFSVGTSIRSNSGGDTFVVYLFASCAGVSKVGSYTGTGATQTINCGFTGGARFVLIKRTNTSGSWFVWDTARGMVSGTDPALYLNSTSAEFNADSVYTTAGGFQILASPAEAINNNGDTYIYLAIA